MKSSVSKNDKAAMKNVNRKIKEMEEALRDRQAMELSDLETGGDVRTYFILINNLFINLLSNC